MKTSNTAPGTLTVTGASLAACYQVAVREAQRVTGWGDQITVKLVSWNEETVTTDGTVLTISATYRVDREAWR